MFLQDAEEFVPERWLDGRQSVQSKDPLSFQPFSAGPRICLGQQFGELSFHFFFLFHLHGMMLLFFSLGRGFVSIHQMVRKNVTLNRNTMVSFSSSYS